MCSVVKFVISLLALFLFTDSATSCSCLWSHPQTGYCYSRLGNGQELFPGKTRTKQSTILRFLPGSKIYNYRFSAYEAMCGVDLTVGKTYVAIGGFVREKKLYINLCQYLQDFDALSPRDKHLLLLNVAVLYKSGCNNCEVLDCSISPCLLGIPQDGICKTSDLSGVTSSRLSSCVKVGKCTWFNGERFIHPEPIPSILPTLAVRVNESEYPPPALSPGIGSPTTTAS